MCSLGAELDQGANFGILKVGETIDVAHDPFVHVGEFPTFLIAEVGRGKVCGEGASGLVTIVGWIAVEGGGGKDYKVASAECYATRFAAWHHGDGPHFRGEIEERYPSGDHFSGAASEPA